MPIEAGPGSSISMKSWRDISGGLICGKTLAGCLKPAGQGRGVEINKKKYSTILERNFTFIKFSFPKNVPVTIVFYRLKNPDQQFIGYEG
jgi:hypothetical protein